MSREQVRLQCFGHGIIDVDTEELIEIGNGEIVTVAV